LLARVGMGCCDAKFTIMCITPLVRDGICPAFIVVGMHLYWCRPLKRTSPLMFKILRNNRWILGVVMSLFLMSCTSEPEKVVRVGTNFWPGYETLYLARSLGYFENSPVRLVELSSTTDVLQAFRNGLLEVAALTMDETLTLLQTESDLRVILVLDISSGADALLANPSSIPALLDLKGKRVAVENSAVGATVLIRALERANLTPEDIKIIPATVNSHYEFYRNGKVDAVVTFEPIKTRLMKEGAKVLFDSREIPGQIVDVLVTRKGLLDKQSKTLQLLVNAQFKALTYLRSHPEEAAKMIAPRLAISPEELTESYKGMVLPSLTVNQSLIKGANPALRQTAKELISMMMERGLLYKEPQIETLISDRFVQ